MTGLFFDDAEVGMRFDTQRRTETEADVVNVCGVSVSILRCVVTA